MRRLLMRWGFALAALVPLSVGLATITSAVQASPAAADSRCPNGGADAHVYSTARYCDGTAASAIIFTFNAVPIYVSDAGDWTQGGPCCAPGQPSQYGHIDDEAWISTSNLAQTIYMESGIYNGYSCGNGCESYWLWWSDTRNGVYYNHFIQRVNMDSSYHWIEFWYDSSTNTWFAASDLYQGGGAYAQSTIQAGPYAWSWTEGLEEYDSDYDGACGGYTTCYTYIDSDEWTGGTFDNYLQVYGEYGPTPYAWHYPSDLSNYWSQPCGSTPGRWPNGECMNGVSTSHAGEWKSNIPG